MKAIGKKLWLPAVTLLIIAMGVLLLAGAISCTQTAQTAETVMKSAETPMPLHAEAPSSAQTPAVLEKRDIPALPKEYTVTGVGTQRHADELSLEQAAAVAVDLWTKIFGDRFKPEDTVLFVDTIGSGVHRSFGVYSGCQFVGGAAYICIVDSISGQPITIQKQTPYDQQVEEEDPESANEDMMTAAMDDPKYTNITEAFINGTFANGRSIKKINQGSVGWDFYQPDVDLIVTCQVQMSEGECYDVTIASPSDEVVQVDFFPLGWLSCYYSYFYAEDGKDYPDHEVKGQLPNMNK